jgi:transcriptional regulator with PAS, ATPase and Fis domain
LHENGPRAGEPFVDLNCASLPRELLESELFGHEKGAFTGAATAKPGLAELAHRGTLFLDEIGDLELSLQPKLLKVLEEQTIRRVGAVRDRQVDIRLIAATHQDLPACVASGTFRSDLYFRISTLPITVPALRDRREDIALLAALILQRLASELGRPPIELALDARQALENYRWPGNVRELRNVLERAVLLNGDGRVRAATLSFEPGGGGARPSGVDYGEATLEEVQRQHILRVLESVNGRVDLAAAKLAIPRSTLYQRLRAMQIAVPRGSRGPKPGDDDDAQQ